MHFRHIWQRLHLADAPLHSMIFTHILLLSKLAPARCAYARNIMQKIFYKQSVRCWRNNRTAPSLCSIIPKHHLSTFGRFLCFADLCLMYELIHGVAHLTSGCRSAGVQRGREGHQSNEIAPLNFGNTAFGPSAFTVRAAENGTGNGNG